MITVIGVGSGRLPDWLQRLTSPWPALQRWLRRMQGYQTDEQAEEAARLAEEDKKAQLAARLERLRVEAEEEWIERDDWEVIEITRLNR